MAVPTFLNSSYRYFRRTGVSDVQTIMDDFSAEVLANSPVWTNPSADLYKSPVDSDSRFFDVLLTRTTQQKLELRVRDQAATTISTRRINCPSTTTWDIRIYTGQYHFMIDAIFTSQAPESLWGGIVDMSPEAQNSHTHYVYGGGSRSNTDTLSLNNWDYNFMVDNVTVTGASRNTTYVAPASSYAGVRTVGGYWLSRPRAFWVQPGGGGNYKYAGRGYQTIVVSTNWIDVGGVFSTPIDTGTIGQFRVIGGALTVSNSDLVLAYRVA